ncbi:MAG: hypothetical protein ABI693_16125 [Bryobacteraceae bacterium]
MLQHWRLWLALALLILPALTLIPRLGIQGDEALFAPGIYGQIPIAARAGNVPVMLMSYVGALKSWLMWPVFAVWQPSVWSLRIPPLLLAAATVMIFAGILKGISGKRAAAAGALLLATDPSFLLTTTFDWGPVALQLFLTCAAVLLLLRQRPAWATFLLGLLLWNKAIAVWILIPAAPVLLFAIPRRRLAVCALTFCAGASPFLWYNATHNLATFRDNGKLSAEHLTYKASVARDTLDGSALFGYLVTEGNSPLPRRSLAAVAALVALAFLLIRGPYRRLALVLTLVAFTSWLFMCLSGGGWGAHHIVLLWPAAQVLIALALAGLERRVAIAIGALLVLSNVAVTARYVQLAETAGPAPLWSDAMEPLTRTLQQLQPTEVVAVDWGIAHPLLLLSAGRLPISIADPPKLRESLTLGAVIVTRPDGHEVQAGRNAQLRAIATPSCEQRLSDSHGRPAFLLLRFDAPCR